MHRWPPAFSPLQLTSPVPVIRRLGRCRAPPSSPAAVQRHGACWPEEAFEADLRVRAQGHRDHRPPALPDRYRRRAQRPPRAPPRDTSPHAKPSSGYSPPVRKPEGQDVTRVAKERLADHRACRFREGRRGVLLVAPGWMCSERCESDRYERDADIPDRRARGGELVAVVAGVCDLRLGDVPEDDGEHAAADEGQDERRDREPVGTAPPELSALTGAWTVRPLLSMTCTYCPAQRAGRYADGACGPAEDAAAEAGDSRLDVVVGRGAEGVRCRRGACAGSRCRCPAASRPVSTGSPPTRTVGRGRRQVRRGSPDYAEALHHVQGLDLGCAPPVGLFPAPTCGLAAVLAVHWETAPRANRP